LGVRAERKSLEETAELRTYVVLDFRPLVQGPAPLDLHALHTESRNVRRQVEAAGFDFVTEGRFLHDDPNPTEWKAILATSPTPLEEQDRFLLKFVKRSR
jgi:predicted methyltransferase